MRARLAFLPIGKCPVCKSTKAGTLGRKCRDSTSPHYWHNKSGWSSELHVWTSHTLAPEDGCHYEDGKIVNTMPKGSIGRRSDCNLKTLGDIIGPKAADKLKKYKTISSSVGKPLVHFDHKIADGVSIWYPFYTGTLLDGKADTTLPLVEDMTITDATAKIDGISHPVQVLETKNGRCKIISKRTGKMHTVSEKNVRGTHKIYKSHYKYDKVFEAEKEILNYIAMETQKIADANSGGGAAAARKSRLAGIRRWKSGDSRGRRRLPVLADLLEEINRSSTQN